MSDEQIQALIEAQIEAHGAACIRVSDGSIFVFSLPVLQELVKAAVSHETQRAVLFIKSGSEAKTMVM